jgi:hypothetical protein
MAQPCWHREGQDLQLCSDGQLHLISLDSHNTLQVWQKKKWPQVSPFFYCCNKKEILKKSDKNEFI